MIDIEQELRRRSKEAMDPRRYIIYSKIGSFKEHRFYYEVYDGCYTMEMKNATQFKSPEVALAVAGVLERHYQKRTRRLLSAAKIRGIKPLNKPHYFVACVVYSRSKFKIRKWEITAPR